MQELDQRIALRLAEDDLRQVRMVQRSLGCNLSEAIRHIVRNTRLEPVTVVKVQQTQSSANHMMPA